MLTKHMAKLTATLYKMDVFVVYDYLNNSKNDKNNYILLTTNA